MQKMWKGLEKEKIQHLEKLDQQNLKMEEYKNKMEIYL